MSDIAPFSNGTEFMWWLDENCCRCIKYWDYRTPLGEESCDILGALYDGQMAGTVPGDIWRRMGEQSGRCQEWQETGGKSDAGS